MGWVAVMGQGMSRQGGMKRPRLAKHMIISRESSTSAREALAGLHASTLRDFQVVNGEAVDGWDQLKSAGVAPLYNAGALPGTTLSTSGSERVAVSLIGGTVQVLGLGSAAAPSTATSPENAARANFFTDQVCQAIRFYRPERILMASITRLVRSTYFEGRVFEAMTDAGVEAVHLGRGLDMDFRTPVGKVIWKFMAAFAAMEHEEICRRTRAGREAKARRQEWVMTRAGIPLGFRVDSSGHVVVDEHAAAAVRGIVAMMGDPSTTDSRLAEFFQVQGISNGGPDSGGWTVTT